MVDDASGALAPTMRVSGAADTSEPRPEIWFRRRINPFSAVRELWSFRELTRTLAERDLRIRYKQAALGIAWAVFLPVILMLAFTLVFKKFAHVDSHGAPYALFAYLGLLPWTFFSSSVADGGLSLTTNTPLLNKVYCPREVFPLGSIVVAATDALIATCVLALLFPITGYAPHWGILYAPLLVLVLLAFTIGVTLVVSATVVYMRDLRLVLPLVLQVGIFLTPVAYNAGVVAKSTSGLALYSALNPLVSVIDGLRRGILFDQAPQWIPLGAAACSSLLVASGGYLLFKKLETGMADVA